MSASITFFPVDNGDMTLLELESGRRVLVDINIREPGEGIRDVAKDLRDRLKTDKEGRPYVDAFLLTHPDQDHVRGLEKHFHLGPLSEYKEPKDGEQGKIIISEMWSSPMVFRRASSNLTLSSDANAWQKEARRRVNGYKQKNKNLRSFAEGDRIQILGEDEGNKTEDIPEIVIKTGQSIRKINGSADNTFSGLLLAPMPKGTEEEEKLRIKNNSSVIINFSLARDEVKEACKFLSGGDAEVGIWERVWSDNKSKPENLKYDLLQAPHHCSWHSLSYYSWSKFRNEAKVSENARNALGQADQGAYIVASSKAILDDDNDPPCIRAKREYVSILAPKKGCFVNTATHEDSTGAVPMVFEITSEGPSLKPAKPSSSSSTGGRNSAAGVLGTQPLMHG